MADSQEKILSRLLEVTRSLDSEADLEANLRLIFSAAVELTGSETASLLEYDETALNFFFKYVPWFHKNANDGKSTRIPLNGSIAGWVFLNNTSVTVNDATNDPRHSKKVDELAGITIHSVLGAPMMARGTPIGVFEVFNKRSAYTNEDVSTLHCLRKVSLEFMRVAVLNKPLAHITISFPRFIDDSLAVETDDVRCASKCEKSCDSSTCSTGSV